MLPPPWEEFTTSEPLRQGHPSEAARNDDGSLPVEHIGAEIDVTRFNAAALHKAGRRGEADGRLGDVVARLGLNAGAKL